ncbi:hypothetical protein [Terrabacter sp. MAHUQ-38]|uniref:hypothetical protein n=1 Tax=unclassified Terrabacter TaxID=2630222 RepID=UPI00165E5657|nr:hypothetical protein [Terrabacter sp. MAHUQ-38]MBC9819715.1 hypothetical protein [Terrabacter sp. MAHUQ-38]
MTSDMDAAIVELRAACRRAYEAQKAKDAALKKRKQVAEQTWKSLHELGPTNIAKQMGMESSRAVVRALTADLQPRPPRGPRSDVTLTRRQADAVTRLRDALVAVDNANKEHTAALDERWFTIRRTWPVLAPMGQRAIARAVGGGYVGESTISVTTTDLRRA